MVLRERGTPQGGVISPLLANLFLHYALDRWLAVHYPQVPFERYADDVIAHCGTEKQAQEMRKAIAARLQSCGLEDWNSIRRKRKSSIARMIFGRRRNTQTKSLIFSVTAFNLGDQRIARGGSSSISVPQSRTKQRRRFVTLFGAGTCITAATRRLKICRGCSIRLSEDGSSITGDTIARHFIRRCAY